MPSPIKPPGASLPSQGAAVSRRDALKVTAGTVALGALGLVPGAAFAGAFARGSDVIRIGLIGCGGRGRGAVRDAVQAAGGVEICALGDLFPDHLAAAREGLESDEDEAIRTACKLTDDTCFAGFDAYKRVVESDIDYVLIACPPYFHPTFIEAAIDAGKHVFCEKPGAIDMPGIHRLLAAGQKAQSQGLGFLSGTQRRHQLSFLETIRRIHEGAIGRPIFGEAFWNNNEWLVVPREEGWSDVEWQVRNWRQNRWLSGDVAGDHPHSLHRYGDVGDGRAAEGGAGHRRAAGLHRSGALREHLRSL